MLWTLVIPLLLETQMLDNHYFVGILEACLEIVLLVTLLPTQKTCLLALEDTWNCPYSWHDYEINLPVFPRICPSALNGPYIWGLLGGLVLGMFTVQMEKVPTIELIIFFIPGVTVTLTNHLYWIGQKVPSVLKVKLKDRFFSFSLITLLTNVFIVLFPYLLPFSRQLHNSIFPKLFPLFQQRTVPAAVYSLSGNWNFSLKEIS